MRLERICFFVFLCNNSDAVFFLYPGLKEHYLELVVNSIFFFLRFCQYNKDEVDQNKIKKSSFKLQIVLPCLFKKNIHLSKRNKSLYNLNDPYLFTFFAPLFYLNTNINL